MGLHMRYWYLSHVSKASFEHLMYEGLNGGGGGGGGGGEGGLVFTIH